jgi:hypothetical protein
MSDDKKQAAAATELLKDAEITAVTLPCLCEFIWVLRRVYGLGQSDIYAALQALPNVGRQAVDVGLAVLYAGGNFADGLIAY